MQSDQFTATPFTGGRCEALGNGNKTAVALAICTNIGTLIECQWKGPSPYFSFNSIPDESQYENGLKTYPETIAKR